MSVPKPKLPHINLKKTLSVVVLVALVSGLGFLSAKHWSNYSNMTANAQAQSDQEQAQAREQERLESQLASNQQVAKYELVRIECEKGLNAWSQLTTAGRNKNPQPVCGPAAAL